MPRYTSALASSINGIGNMMLKGKDAYRMGEDRALKDALAMGQMENLQSQIDAREAESAIKQQRADYQRRMATDPLLQTEIALGRNKLSSRLANALLEYEANPMQQHSAEVAMPSIQGITAAPATVSYSTPAALPAGIDETALGNVLRSRADLQTQFGLTGDSDLSDFAKMQEVNNARGDYEAALRSPLAMTLYNAAQASQKGDLYSNAGNGLTLSQAGGTQTVAAPELYRAEVDRLVADAAQSRAAADNSTASANKTRWEMGAGGPGLGKVTGVGQRYLSTVMQEDDGYGGMRNVSRLDPEKVQRYGRWAAANGKPMNDATALEWAVAGSPDAGGGAPAPAAPAAPAGGAAPALRMENGQMVQPLVPASNPDLTEFLALYRNALTQGRMDYARMLEQRAREARLIR